MPKLMAELGLTGVLFTADALHCQKDGLAQAVVTGNALLVRVKDNQPTLHATLAGLCATGCPFDSHETVERGRHGRQEHRRVEVFDTAGQLDAPWQTLVSCVARVSRLTYIKDTHSGLWATREDASRIRTKPGIMARIRSVALNVLRANGIQNISNALYANTVSFDQLLALGTQ